NSLCLLISRAQRQAKELLRYCKQGFRALRWPVPFVRETETELELANGSRIVSLPGKESNIRSYQGVSLLVIDEAARVPQDLIGSVTPMIGVSKGKFIMLSTPWGQQGFFYTQWHDAQAKYARFRVPWQKCPRYTAEFIEQERRRFGTSWVEQEYECSFESLSGLVYPDFQEQCGTICWEPPPAAARFVGGIDWGFYAMEFKDQHGVTRKNVNSRMKDRRCAE